MIVGRPLRGENLSNGKRNTNLKHETLSNKKSGHPSSENITAITMEKKKGHDYVE